MPTFDEAIRAIAEQEMPASEHALIETFQDSTYFWANTNLSLMRTWVIQTDLMLDKSLEDTDVPMFYIRLHGLAEEMYAHFYARRSSLNDLFGTANREQLVEEIKKMTGDVRMRNFLQLSVRMGELLEQIRSDFSEFELKQITFFRHRFCHPLLTKLSITIKKKKFTRVEIDKMMREISETDELDAMAAFHARILNRRPLIKEMDGILRSMQFS